MVWTHRVGRQMVSQGHAGILRGVTYESGTTWWVVGGAGVSGAPPFAPLLQSYDRSSGWTPYSIALGGEASFDVRGVSLLSGGDIWAVGQGDPWIGGSSGYALVAHYDGSAWTLLGSQPPHSTYDLRTGEAILAVGTDEVYVGGFYSQPSSGLLRLAVWDGVAWAQSDRTVYTGGSATQQAVVRALDAALNLEIWAGGNMVGPGASGFPFAAPNTAYGGDPAGIWGGDGNTVSGLANRADGVVWACYGDAGTGPQSAVLVHYDRGGAGWDAPVTLTNPGTTVLYWPDALTEWAGTYVWVAGYYYDSSLALQPVIWRITESTGAIRVETLPSYWAALLHGIKAYAANAILAVGEYYTPTGGPFQLALWFDGTGWSDVSP